MEKEKEEEFVLKLKKLIRDFNSKIGRLEDEYKTSIVLDVIYESIPERNRSEYIVIVGDDKSSAKYRIDFHKWLLENTNFEDPDSTLLFNTTEEGEIAITDYNSNDTITGKSLKEVCEKWDEENEKYYR